MPHRPRPPGHLISAGALLADGTHLRLRFCRPGDAPEVAELLAAAGEPGDDLAVAALLRFDPRERAVVCATVGPDGREVVVAIGWIDLAPGAEPRVAAAPSFAEEVEPLLAGALLARARTRRSA